jgi:putative hydrolase of the HAD superfamily
MIHAVTFDAGGTLLEPWPSVGHVYAAVAAEHGWPEISPEALNRQFRAAWRVRGDFRHTRREWEAMVDATFAGLVEPPPSRTFFPALFDCFATPRAWRLYDDALPALRRLKAGKVPMGLISNWDDRLRPLLDRLGVLEFFQSVVISCEFGCAKPDHRVFAEAARQLNLEPGRILHVGDDEEDDVDGARAAGFQARLIDRQAGTTSDHRLASLSDMPALVGRRSSNNHRDRPVTEAS